MIDLAAEYLSRGDFERAKTELARTRSHISDAMDEFRSFLFQLNPTGLKDGFEAALRRLASSVVVISGADMKFSVEGAADESPMPLRSSVFKIIQEAVTNSVKNGRARRIRVLVSAGPGMLKANITDDGTGFDVEKTLAEAGEKGAWGLLNMRNGLLSWRGTEHFKRTGQGTTVRWRFPAPVPK